VLCKICKNGSSLKRGLKWLLETEAGQERGSRQLGLLSRVSRSNSAAKQAMERRTNRKEREEKDLLGMGTERHIDRLVRNRRGASQRIEQFCD
jgi:hypothetical protein